MELSYKQRLFVSYYLGESKGNATDAARRAGYREHQVTGHRLLRKANIAAAIEAKLDSVAMRQDEILARLSDIAAASLGDFIKFADEKDKEKWMLSILKGRIRGKLHTLKKVKRGKDGDEIEVKDAMPALVKLGEYHGLFKQRSEIEMKGTRVVVLPPKRSGNDAGSAGPPE